MILSSSFISSNIKPVRANDTIYIRADGSVEGTLLITSNDNVTYCLTADIFETIIVEKDNIIIDGANHVLYGKGIGDGINLTYRNNVTIKNMEVTNFGNGIHFHHSFNCKITSINLYSNVEKGIYLSFSNNNIINNNLMSSNKIPGDFLPPFPGGIGLYQSNNNIVSNNNFSNLWGGIGLSNCSNNLISNNNLAECQYGIDLGELCNKNLVSENMLYSITRGISLEEYSFNNTITKNSIQGNKYSQWIDGIISLGNNNLFSQNNVSDAVNGFFVSEFEEFGQNNIFTKNQISNNSYGFLLRTTNNVFSYNEISSNFHGIHFFTSGCTNNSILFNRLDSNDVAFYFERAHIQNNIIFHNNIIDNNQQVVFENPSSDAVNIWDDGYPSGGNYWDDYTGIDANHDGIGDTPYIIDDFNTDRYPLVKGCPDFVVPEVPFGSMVAIIAMVCAISVFVIIKKRTR